jgi:hypothetical protein
MINIFTITFIIIFIIIIFYNKEQYTNSNNTYISDNIYKKCKNIKVREDGLLCAECLSADNINYIYSCNFCKLNNYGLRNGNLVCH